MATVVGRSDDSVTGACGGTGRASTPAKAAVAWAITSAGSTLPATTRMALLGAYHWS